MDEDGAVRLGPLHYLRMRATQDLLAAALAAKDMNAISAGLGAARALLPYYHAVYPKVEICCRPSIVTLIRPESRHEPDGHVREDRDLHFVLGLLPAFRFYSLPSTPLDMRSGLN